MIPAHTTELPFPKDCRDDHARVLTLNWIWTAAVVAVFAGMLVDAFLFENAYRHLHYYFVLVLAAMVAYAFHHRCPACKGGLSARLSPRHCQHCGSFLSEESAPSGGKFIPVPSRYRTDRDLPRLVRILDRSPDRLRFRARRMWVMGGLITLASLAALLFLCDSVVVECRRDSAGEVHARLARQTLGISLQTRFIPDVRRAMVQTDDRRHSARHSEGGTSRVVLETANGLVPLTAAFTSDFERHQQFADRFNGFLSRKDARKEVLVLDPGPWGWIVFWFLFLIGFGLLNTRPDEFVMDRTSRRFQIFRRGLGTSCVLRYSFDDITGFGLIESESDHPAERRSTQLHYGVGMRLRNGAVVQVLDRLSSYGREKQLILAGCLENYRQSVPPAAEANPPKADFASGSGPAIPAKICVVCGQDCSQVPRYQDETGRYYHQACLSM